MFEKTRLKLTAWYLLIIMLISIVFSLVIFTKIDTEFTRFERFQVRLQNDIKEGRIREFPRPSPNLRLNPEEIRKARVGLIISLTFINFAILVFAGSFGYFLAGKTLSPIKQMVDEQNRFVSDSSHELRTPLTALRTQTEVALLNKNLTLLDSKKTLKSNLEEIINLQLLTDNLLDLAQNGHKISKNELQIISLSDVLNSAIKKVETNAKSKNVKINQNVKNIEIIGLPDQLTQVFVNLLDNAIKYSFKNGKVKITAKKLTDKVEVCVADNGMGISENDLPHIFDRFYQVDKSRNKLGYGLGLAISKKIINSLGGTIRVVSKPEIITQFFITLPA